MHCSNPKCYDDSCNGECEKVEQVKEERDWPWYRYEIKEEAKTKEEEAQGLSETKKICYN
tara:strand:+ start:55 stop:234 length:180 start_codon:yes stop_codon:yes gene_type:complete